MARKILLADDSVTAQNMGRKILTDAGYDVITVNNGSAALKRVAEHKPDLIVLDVYMPGYSGLEVCVRLKDAPETCRIPVLLTVGKLEPFKPEEASRVRADAYIIKPFEASELLSVLTRLEDRMVPQADGGRFSTTVSGIERFSSDPMMRKTENTDEETGWRSRLRFPSKKKKEEPEPPPSDEEIGVTPFRDFKKNAPKPVPSGSFAVNNVPPTAQEPGLVPDIPRDITPEELDALSDLVAKLDGPIPPAEDIAPIGESLAPTASARSEEKVAEAKSVDQKVEDAKPEIKAEEIKAEVVITPAAEVAEPAAATAPTAEVASAAAPLVSEPVAETPVVETAVETPSVAPESTVEATPMETVAAEKASAKTEPQESVIPEKESVSTEIATSEEESSPETEPEAAPVASQVAAPQVEKSAVVEEISKTEVSKEEVATIEGATAEARRVEATPEPEPVSSATMEASPGESAAPEPSAEELAEALRLLTPSHAGESTLAEAGAKLAEELARGAASSHRWVAEKVALTTEESSLSLEAEMFKSFAAQSTTEADPVAVTNASSDAPVAHEEEEAAEAAVEAAEADAADEATQESEVASHAAAVEKQAREIVAEVPAEPVNAESAQERPGEKPSLEPIDEPIDEDVAAVTFADAIRSEESETAAASSATEISISEEQRGDDDMAKDSKGKWHQIHSTPEPAAKADVVEAAKQSEEAPKAMAAAAGDGGSSDATAIASIVDSVLADLKPKIVEEIVKKLAKK